MLEPGGLPEPRHDLVGDAVEFDVDLVEQCVPGYPPLTKRLPKDNGWFDALRMDHVELVSDPIERFTATGIRTVEKRVMLTPTSSTTTTTSAAMRMRASVSLRSMRTPGGPAAAGRGRDRRRAGLFPIDLGPLKFLPGFKPLFTLALPFLQGFLFLAIGAILLSISSKRIRLWVESHTRRYPRTHAFFEKNERWLQRIIGPLE